MLRTSSEVLSEVGRPCPNFQRLIEYVEPVEGEDEEAAGDRLQWGTDLYKRSSHITASILRWNPRTNRLRINPCTLRNPRLPNYPLRRRSKLKDFSAEMTKKMENPAGGQQAKPIVKIKPNSSKAKPSGSMLATQLDVELTRLLTQYGVSASDLERRLQQLSLELEDR